MKSAVTAGARVVVAARQSYLYLVQSVAEVRDAIVSERLYTLCLRLTLLLALLHGSNTVGSRIAVLSIGGLMVMAPALLQSAFLWWIIVIVVTAGNITVWHTLDNHKYLITYWLLATALSVSTEGGVAQLRRSASLLVSMVFLLATVWKLLAGQYLNGDFMYWTFLTDVRLARLTAAIAGLTVGEVTLFGEAIRSLGTLGAQGAVVDVFDSHRVQVFTMVLSWAVLAVEGAIAALFITHRERLYWPRHLVLMAFICGTYFLVPVAGFSFVLLVLGIAQTRETDDGLRLAYVVLFGCIHLQLYPWQTALNVDM